MRISRVYTRTGDRGSTRLVGGTKVSKDAIRIEAYGTVDELNAVLGMARTENKRASSPESVIIRVDNMLQQVQNDLFDLGADLATRAEDRWPTMYRVGDADVERLEQWCDELNGDLEPLKEFILPGGGPVGAAMHLGRTVCRRAERRVVTLLSEEEEVGTDVLRYLNRLSDFLFILGRWVAKEHGESEFLWKRRTTEGG